jgi:phosphate transport system substrate-binding protein
MLLMIGFLTTVFGIYLLIMNYIVYIPFLIATSISVFLLFVFVTFGLLEKKNGKKGFWIGIAVLYSIAGVYLVNQHYHENMDTVSAEVDLEQYQPNMKGSKVASLESKASLKLPDDDLLILDGATALYPLYSSFVQATYTEREYTLNGSTVLASKTDQAYMNLINGKVDIIFVAGPSESQLKYAKTVGVELEMTPIGREAFVFFVHANNTVESLTSEQIRDIYSGKVTNWRDVGGKNDKIRAFQRPVDSGSQTAIYNFMGREPLMKAPTDDIVTGMGGVISEVAEYKNYRNAIGYTFRFFSTEMVRNKDIRLLAVDEVFPDKETIRSGEYPATAEFYAITAGTTNPNAETRNW